MKVISLFWEKGTLETCVKKSPDLLIEAKEKEGEK